MKKLEIRDVVKEFTLNSVYIPSKEDIDKKNISIMHSLNLIISVCENEKFSEEESDTIYMIIDCCNDSKKKLSEKYPKKGFLKNKNDLEDKDRIYLIEEFLNLKKELIARVEYSKIILNLDPKKNLDVNKKSLKILDKSTKADLEEGLELLQSGHFTASYMILMRVAEFFVLQYYKKITGMNPDDANRAWGNMLHSLQNEYNSKIDKNFGNLLYYLKDRRNEALHPGKRFDEKDCNKLLTYLTEYVDYFAKQK